MDSNRRPAGYEPAAIDRLSYVAINPPVRVEVVAGAGFEPRDLRVMSPTSYLAALPRDISFYQGYIILLDKLIFVNCFCAFKKFILVAARRVNSALKQ